MICWRRRSLSDINMSPSTLQVANQKSKTALVEKVTNVTIRVSVLNPAIRGAGVRLGRIPSEVMDSSSLNQPWPISPIITNCKAIQLLTYTSAGNSVDSGPINSSTRNSTGFCLDTASNLSALYIKNHTRRPRSALMGSKSQYV